MCGLQSCPQEPGVGTQQRLAHVPFLGTLVRDPASREPFMGRARPGVPNPNKPNKRRAPHLPEAFAEPHRSNQIKPANAESDSDGRGQHRPARVIGLVVIEQHAVVDHRFPVVVKPNLPTRGHKSLLSPQETNTRIPNSHLKLLHLRHRTKLASSCRYNFCLNSRWALARLITLAHMKPGVSDFEERVQVL